MDFYSLPTLCIAESANMRAFSTSAKALLKFMWDGMNKETKWEEAGRKVIENNKKLPSIEIAKVK